MGKQGVQYEVGGNERSDLPVRRSLLRRSTASGAVDMIERSELDLSVHRRYPQTNHWGLAHTTTQHTPQPSYAAGGARFEVNHIHRRLIGY